VVTQTTFSISYVRPESDQLFFLFVGIWNTLTIQTLDFLRETAIGDRNIVILKDPYRWHCYHRGVSDQYDSLDGIARWQRDEIATRFSHVREVFCAGASAGGSPAIHTACRLGARAAWSLGGRIVNPLVVEERERVSRAFYQRLLGCPAPRGLTPAEHATLLAAFDEPGMRQLRWDLTSNPETVAARDRVGPFVDMVRDDASATDFHFYYATTNVIDREFAEAFQDCPKATLHPITPPSRDWSQDVSFRDPDHGIVPLLYELGQLGGVFSAYL
jgi:hypothetical protein